MSQRKMFEIKCTACGETGTVPFKPTKGKPAYCRTCFSKHKKGGGSNLRFPHPMAWAIG